MREFAAIIEDGTGKPEIVEIIRNSALEVDPGQAIPVWFVSYYPPHLTWWERLRWLWH